MPKNYNALFQANPLGFMREYSCNPASNLSGYEGVVDPTDFKVKNNTYSLNTTEAVKRIGYLDFVKQAHNSGTPITGQIVVTGDYVANPARVASYFLPWSPQHVITLTIPTMLAHRQGVPYFFTAAINGCSVFVKGTAKNPTVYHAGGDTGQVKPKKGADFWRKLLETHAVTKSKVSGKTLAEVNKTHYTVDKVQTVKNASGIPMVQKLGTAHSREFEDWLKNAAVGQNLTIHDVAPTGCVFGLRDRLGDWSFYLQENASITYTRVTNTAAGPVITTTRTAMRPMQTTRIFPGSGHAAYNPGLTRMLKG